MLDLTKLLAVMIEHDASDLYITVDSPPMYRINGVVRPAGNRCLQSADTESLANSVMNDKQQREFQEKHEQNLALYFPALGRFRVNIFRQRTCVGLVIRQIRSNIRSIDDLALPPILKDIALTKRGLALVVGATGAGKSTTLAALIDYRNEQSPGHIITIEDPIEFMHAHKKSIVTQREVGIDTSSFQIGLKNALRQAPDVILVGEIRDSETMEAAIAFAEPDPNLDSSSMIGPILLPAKKIWYPTVAAEKTDIAMAWSRVSVMERSRERKNPNSAQPRMFGIANARMPGQPNMP